MEPCTCEAYINCARSCLHLEKGIFHYLYPDLIAKGTRIDHLSAFPVSEYSVKPVVQTHKRKSLSHNYNVLFMHALHKLAFFKILTFTIASLMKSYSNRFSWSCKTGGKSMKRTPFFASCKAMNL